jgi:hypothetical protein
MPRYGMCQGTFLKSMLCILDTTLQQGQLNRGKADRAVAHVVSIELKAMSKQNRTTKYKHDKLSSTSLPR